MRCSPARLALALAGLLVSIPVHALGPGWGYVDYARSWGTPQVNESGKGSVAHLSIPLGDSVFAVAGAERLDARYADGKTTERFELASAGVGLHTVERSVHLFGLVHYAQKWRAQHTPSGDTHEPAGGLGLAAGARWLATPYLSVEGQYGLKGYVIDGFTKLDVALRVLPHVWLLGTFDHGPFSGNEFCAGLRWAWEEYSPARLPRARPADAMRGGAFVGQTLIVLHPLVPQARPLAGAPELPVVADGAQIVLQESTENRFGTWWRIAAGDESGWVRETDLLGRPE